MLTREHAIVAYEGGRVLPDRLTTKRHSQYRRYAEQMVRIYRDGKGRTRQELHRDVQLVFEKEFDCPARRIAGFCKLLDDAGTWLRDRKGKAAKLRREVFHAAAPFHPLVTEADGFFEHQESRIKTMIAEQRGTTWEEIDRELFADILQFHRLNEFDAYENPLDLLARYNVAQTQAALFDAIHMTVFTKHDFKMILRYAKLAGLMHSIERWGDDGYRFTFDGPASVLRQTRRYGVAMARFLPGLLSCKGWRLHAKIQRSRSSFLHRLDLSPADGLRSEVATSMDYDSTVEAKFAARWGTEPREGWRLIHEGEVLHSGQKVFVPDFVFQHQDGHQVMLEIVGYWTPEYLEQKVDTLKRFADYPIILAAAKHVDTKQLALNFPVIYYKTVLKLEPILEQLRGYLPTSESENKCDENELT